MKSKDQIIAELRAENEQLRAKLSRQGTGRRPSGKRALTVAERVAKHRAAKKAAPNTRRNMRIELIEYCNEDNCRCADRNGVVIGIFESRAEAEEAARTQVRPGYDFVLEEKDRSAA